VGDGIFGDKYGDLGRNNSLPDCNRLPTLISIFDDNQCVCLGASSNVGGVTTVHLCSMCNKYVHYHNTPPASDPVKLDLHLSPLGGETTSTPVSKFHSNLSSDAVDQDPSVERLSNTAEQHESRQQGHIVSPVTSRKDELMERPAEIDGDSFILVTGKNAARRPQQQIQSQQPARGQPTTQYDALSSDEDDEDEESKSDEDDEDEESKSDGDKKDEEIKSKEEDNNKRKAPRTQKPRSTRELRAPGISQESDEKSEEPRPTRSKMTRELRSLGTIPPSEESTTTTTSSNNEGSPGAIHSAITSDPGVPTTFDKAYCGPMSHIWRPAIYE
jgi:hypothetical protein